MPENHHELKGSLVSSVHGAIRSTINKFRENPDYFFTESDIHSYFYHRLYHSRYEVRVNGHRVYLVHREFPTDFRYDKVRLADDSYSAPYPLDSNLGARGHYDIGVLDPTFVAENPDIDMLRNKDIAEVKKRAHLRAPILLFAVEFKYIISNSKKWPTEVANDSKKLLFGKTRGVHSAFNLVFCNLPYKYDDNLAGSVSSTDSAVNAILVRSLDADGSKPKPLTNNPGFFSKMGLQADQR